MTKNRTMCSVKRFYMFFLLIFLFSALFVTFAPIAYADETGDAGEESSSTSWFGGSFDRDNAQQKTNEAVAEIKVKGNETYSLIRKISGALAAVGLSGAGIGLMISDENEVKRQLKKIIYICMGLAVISLLPTIIQAGQNIISGYVWDPTSYLTV